VIWLWEKMNELSKSGLVVTDGPDAGPLILDFPDSRTMSWYIYMNYKSLSVSYSVIAACSAFAILKDN
jgi:hypothetical protein